MAGLSLGSVLLVVTAGALAWALVGSGHGSDNGGEPSATSSVAVTPAHIDPDGAARVLRRLQQALHRDDRPAAAALAGSDDPATAARLEDLVDVVRRAQLADVTFRYVDRLGGVDSDGVWTARVDTTWRFAGFDRAPASAEVSFAFRDTGEGVRLAGVGGERLRTPVWMSGPIQVRRTTQTLVLVAGENPTLSRYAGFAARAVPVVRRVVTTWRPRLVVEVPVDLEGLDRALAEPVGADAAIAAVASSVDGSSAPGAPVHVLVNPDVFATLPRLGAQVVMSHESTHIATDASRSAAPTWLKEGIADFTALRDVRLPLSATAAQIARQVARTGLPAELPTGADFDPQAPHLGSVYEAAWLACVTLVDRSGQDALLALYDRTSRGAALEPSLRSLFGWSTADLIAAWRTRLSHLPGA